MTRYRLTQASLLQAGHINGIKSLKDNQTLFSYHQEKEEAPMKIDAKITKTLPTGNVKAIADVVLDDSVVIHGVKLIDSNGAKFVSMPSDKWQDKDGNYKHTDIVHPTNAGTRSDIFRAVEGAYQTHSQTAAAAPTDISM